MIIRGPRPDRYVIIANEIAQDERLSFRARGLLTLLLSKPEGWRTNSTQLALETPREGRDAIRTALRELETVGYLTRRRHQDTAGRWITDTIVTDEPVDNYRSACG